MSPQPIPQHLAATAAPDRASCNTLLATTGRPAARSRRITWLSMNRLETTSTAAGVSGSNGDGDQAKAGGVRQRLLHLEVPAVGVLAEQGNSAARGGNGDGGVDPVVAAQKSLPADAAPRL